MEIRVILTKYLTSTLATLTFLSASTTITKNTIWSNDITLTKSVIVNKNIILTIKKDSLIETAYDNNVPIFCPAFTDSSAWVS